MSLFWKNNDMLTNLKATYKFLYLRLLTNLTKNLFKKKHIYFLNLMTKNQLKILDSKVRVQLFSDTRIGSNLQITGNQIKKLNYNKTLLGQILTIRSNDRILTLVSLFKFKKKNQNKIIKKKTNSPTAKANLYKTLRVFVIN